MGGLLSRGRRAAGGERERQRPAETPRQLCSSKAALGTYFFIKDAMTFPNVLLFFFSFERERKPSDIVQGMHRR